MLMFRYLLLLIVSTLALIIITGCVERESELSDRTEPPTTPSSSPETAVETPTPAAQPGYADFDENPCSWKEIVDPAPSEPFEDLAWKSHQVAVGTVVEEVGSAWMEPDPRHPGRPGQCLQIMTDFHIEIETHYRGVEADPLRVRVRGGELDGYKQESDVSPQLAAGDRLLMFLVEAPESDVLPEAWLAYENRVWQIDEQNQITGDEFLDDFAVLDLAVIDERIRDALGRRSHILGTRNVTGDEAPIHVDRDEDREPISGAPCSHFVDIDVETYPPIEDLAWSSEYIVVGTVTADHGPAWSEPGNLELLRNTDGCMEIMNDYEIEIEHQFHGEPADSLRIRAPGGELDGYEQRHGLGPELEPGERYLFFLFKAPPSEMLPDAWAFDVQRARIIQPDEMVATGHDSSMTLNEIEQLIDETLAGDPPPAEVVHRALWGSENSPTFE
jgi:hypothetical protein